MASEIKVDTVSEKTSGSGVTIDGLLIKDGGISGDVSLIGTTPTFTIGDAGAEDAALVFDGNAQDFYVGLDDSSDSLVMGLGSALGTTPAITINSSQVATLAQRPVFSSGITIADAGQIGSASDADAIAIASNGVVTFSQNPVFPDGGVAVADLDIDGATDIGAAIVDADLFIIDDGAGGTNRKVTASRLKTYAGFDPDASVTINDSGAAADFRVETDSLTHAIHTDGGNNRIGLGATPSLGLVHIQSADSGATADSGADELVIEGSGDAGITILSGTSGSAKIHFGDSGDNNIGYLQYDHANNKFIQSVNADGGTLIMTSDGNIQHGGTTNSARFTTTTPSAEIGIQINCTSASFDANCINLVASRDTTNETYNLLRGQNGAGFAVAIRDSGNVENVNNSYGSSSDERIKQNITDASSQWDDIKALKIRNYKLKKDTSKTLIGVVAQELEASGMNGLVGGSTAEDKETVALSSDFGTLHTEKVLYVAEDDDVKKGTAAIGDTKHEIGDIKTVDQKVKSVKYSVLYMKAIKALQEAQTRIETLESKVTALEG